VKQEVELSSLKHRENPLHYSIMIMLTRQQLRAAVFRPMMLGRADSLWGSANCGLP